MPLGKQTEKERAGNDNRLLTEHELPDEMDARPIPTAAIGDIDLDGLEIIAPRDGSRRGLSVVRIRQDQGCPAAHRPSPRTRHTHGVAGNGRCSTRAG